MIVMGRGKEEERIVKGLRNSVFCIGRRTVTHAEHNGYQWGKLYLETSANFQFIQGLTTLKI